MEVQLLSIKCKHGDGIAACVCKHLLENIEPDIGFVENSDLLGDLQAWCTLCEEFFLQEGEMTEAFKKFHDLKLVCEDCYAEIKARYVK